MPKKIKLKKNFIVKFQRPIMTNGSYQEILLYNEERTIVHTIELGNDKIDALFPNNEFKTYWLCHINKETKMLETIKQVEEQEW